MIDSIHTSNVGTDAISTKNKRSISDSGKSIEDTFTGIVDKEPEDKNSNKAEEIEIKSETDKLLKTDIISEDIDDHEDGLIYNEAVVRSPISSVYISYNTKKMISEILIELDKWIDVGTDDGLVYISNAKNVLDRYSEYLVKRSENRILLSMLELIFCNNLWESLQKDELVKIRELLKKFNTGDLDYKKLKLFSKELFKQRISVFDSK